MAGHVNPTCLFQRFGLAALAILALALIVSATYLTQSISRESSITPSPRSAAPDTPHSESIVATPTVSPSRPTERELSADEWRDQCKFLSARVSALAEELRDFRERLHLNWGAHTVNEEQLEKQRLVVNELGSRYAALCRLTPDNLPEALQILNIEDSTVMQVDQHLREALDEHAALRQSGFSASSPQVRALTQQIQVYQQLSQNQFANILRAQGTKLEIEKAQLATDEANFAAWRETLLHPPEPPADYRAMEAALNAAGSLLLEAEQRYQAAHLQETLSKDHIRQWRIAPAQR